MPAMHSVYQSRASYLPTPVLWFDASDTSTITQSSNRVVQWTDKSPNGYVAVQTDQNTAPTTGLTTWNGRNVVNFSSASTTHLDTTASFTQISGNNPHDIYIVVVSATLATTWSKFFLMGNYTTSGATRGLGPSSTSGRLGFTFCNSDLIPLPTLNTTSPFLIQWRYDGGTGNQYGFVNNAATNPVSQQPSSLQTINTPTLPFRLGWDGANAAECPTFNFAELLVYDRVLSAAEKNVVVNYLNKKWSVY